MLRLTLLGCGLAALVSAGMALAEDSAVQVIPRTYVSPGASGSIEMQQRSQRYDIHGGQAIPRGTVREYRSYSNERYEQRGSIRQSTEYPGGIEVEHAPGGTRYRSDRNQ
jgi:hypothetical protein